MAERRMDHPFYMIIYIYIYIHGIDMEVCYNVGISQNGWFTMQHPFKIVDLGVLYPHFRKPPYSKHEIDQTSCFLWFILTGYALEYS